jgi:hypothetical protein
MDIHYFFAYAVFMFQGPANRKMFVVTCKRCLRDIPTGVSEFPFKSITVVAHFLRKRSIPGHGQPIGLLSEEK